MTTGWVHHGKNDYYFDPKTGRGYKGWHTIDDQKYYFNAYGQLARSRFVGNTYYVNAEGQRVYGWLNIGDKTYYLQPKTGAVLKKGWHTIEQKKYYILDDHSVAKNIWINEDQYLDENGAYASGWKEIDGKTYYFDPNQNGAMALNTELTIDGLPYLFDADGHMSPKKNVNGNENLGQKIAIYAQQFIGYPYAERGDQDLTQGVDCSGFVMLVMRHFGISVPRTSYWQHDGLNGYKKPVKIPVEDLKPGDLILYYTDYHHVAIYIGDGKIVHASNSAPYPQGGIKISNYDYTYIYGCVRYWY